MAKRYWLMKVEPGVYGIDDLRRDKTEHWEGVRNYQARNFMRDDMKNGDMVLFYHSNATPSGVAGVARVCRESYPDHFAFDPQSRYFDPKSSPDNPRWFMVDVEFVERFDEVLPLTAMKDDPLLAGMPVLQKGQRLSVMPVEKEHFRRVLHLAGARTRV